MYLKKYFPILLYSALALNFVAAVHSAVELRQLFSEGAHWLFVLLNNGEFQILPEFNRYSDTLAQLPTYLLVHLFKDYDISKILVYTFSFSYGLYLFLFIGLIIVFNKKSNSHDLFQIFCLALGLFIFPGYLIPEFHVAQSCVYFFLYLFIRSKGEELSYKRVLLVLVAVNLIGFNHEAGAPFLIVIGLNSFFLARKKINIISNYFILALAGLFFLRFVLHVVNNRFPIEHYFHSHLTYFFYYAYFMVASVYLSFLIHYKFSHSRLAVLVLYAIPIYFVARFITELRFMHPWEAFELRTLMVLSIFPLCGLLFLVKKLSLEAKESFRNYLSYMAILSLITSFSIHTKLTNVWTKSYANFNKINVPTTGCSILAQPGPDAFFKRDVIEFSVPPVILELSIISQMKKNIDSISIPFQNDLIKTSRCETFKKTCNLNFSDSWPIFYLQKNTSFYFDFELSCGN